MAKRKPKAKPTPARKPKVYEPAVDAMQPPNHLTPYLIHLQRASKDGARPVSVFVRRHERFPGASKYYPDNPQGAQFAVTWVNPFTLQKLLLADPTLAAEAAKIVKADKRRTASTESKAALHRLFDKFVEDIKAKLYAESDLIYDFAVTQLAAEIKHKPTKSPRSPHVKSD